MRTGAVIVGAALLAGVLGRWDPARAEMTPLLTAGPWTAYVITEGDDVICGASWTGLFGTVAVSAQRSDQRMIMVTVTRREWNFRPGAEMHMLAAFPGGNAQRIAGYGSGETAYFELDQAMLPPWMHEFTARQRMFLTIDHDPVLVWDVDLTGTTAAITVVSDCTHRNGFTGLPRPFTPAGAPSTTAEVRPPAAVESRAIRVGVTVQRLDYFGCTLGVVIRNDLPVAINHIEVVATVENNGFTAPTKFSAAMIDPGMSQITTARVSGEMCMPSSSVTLRYVQSCDVGGELFASCASLLKQMPVLNNNVKWLPVYNRTRKD